MLQGIWMLFRTTTYIKYPFPVHDTYLRIIGHNIKAAYLKKSGFASSKTNVKIIIG